jgi:putative endonuclease
VAPSGWYQRRRSVGRLGEDIAAFVLRRHGITVAGRNLRVGRGEIDLLAADRGEPLVAEVKTLVTTAPGDDPAEAFTAQKEAQVRKLAARLRPPVRRIDLLSVSVRPDGVRVRWTPRIG